MTYCRSYKLLTTLKNLLLRLRRKILLREWERKKVEIYLHSRDRKRAMGTIQAMASIPAGTTIYPHEITLLLESYFEKGEPLTNEDVREILKISRQDNGLS